MAIFDKLHYMIDLHRLLGFHLVATEGGYAKAARAADYPITQPALHQQVRKLEGEIGVTLLLEELEEYMPSPTDRGKWDGGEGAADAALPSTDAPFSAVVFKTIIDRYTGTMSVMRVVSGTVRADSHIMDATTGEKLRVGKLMLLQGEKHVEIAEAGPGDIVAVAKLKDVHTGHVLTEEKGGIHLHELEIPGGVISYAIEAGRGKEDEKVFGALAKLAEEDPSLHIGRDEATGEFLLTGMGELHIRTTAKKLDRLFGLEVHTLLSSLLKTNVTWIVVASLLLSAGFPLLILQKQ